MDIVFLLAYSVYMSVCVLYSNCYILNMFSIGLAFTKAARWWHRRWRRFILPSSFSGTACHYNVFTARRLAKRGICRRRVSVSVCVCPSHSGIVSKRLNVGSRKVRRTIAP